MKYPLIIFLFALIAPFQVAGSKTLELQTVIKHALQNSPETAQIFNTLAKAEAEAFDIETLSNPTAEINATAFKNDASRSIDLELEQPMRISTLGSRRSYADAIRQTASIEQKAQILELIHSITRGYASYWALQEQEMLLTQNADYAHKKQKLVQRAAQEGRVDAADAKIFHAEALHLEEQLRVIRAKKTHGATTLMQMAGMDQALFHARRPEISDLPDLATLASLAENEGSIRSLLESRKTLAERRYNVAQQDAGFPEFAPRAIIEHDFDDSSTVILFGVTIAIPIWDRNKAELVRARAERHLAQSNLNALREHHFANVLSAAFEQARATQQSALNYRNKIVPSWHEVQLIADKKFANGQASILDLFQIRKRMTDVQSEALQIYLHSIEARISLESLIGQSLNHELFTDTEE